MKKIVLSVIKWLNGVISVYPKAAINIRGIEVDRELHWNPIVFSKIRGIND